MKGVLEHQYTHFFFDEKNMTPVLNHMWGNVKNQFKTES